jgi:peptide/nickel transport system permease protein
VLKFIGGRLVQMLVLFVLFLTILFFLLQAQPGDISQQFVANPQIPPEAKALLAARLGLDKPLWIQYVNYMRNFFTGDMGVSFSQYPRPVAAILLERAPRTIMLFLSATMLAYFLGFTLGKIVAWRRGAMTEYPVTIGGVFLYTVFYPWFALLMIWFWAFIVGWFPVGKFLDPPEWRNAPVTANMVFNRMIISAVLFAVAMFAVWLISRRADEPRTTRLIRRVGALVVTAGFLAYWLLSPVRPYATDIAHHVLLPVITLSLVIFAGVMLLTRSSMLETLREDYILTARAKGLPERAIRDRHAARNALLPVTTSLVIALAFVISGGIITETIFSWPGMGDSLVEAVTREDIPLAIGTLSVVGVLALVGHLIVDIVYVYLDPRIRYK